MKRKPGRPRGIPRTRFARWLGSYITHGGTIEDLAEELECSASHVYSLAAGATGISLALAFRIEKATAGKVPASSSWRRTA